MSVIRRHLLAERLLNEVMHVHAFLIPLIMFFMSCILSMAGAGEGIKITIRFSLIGVIMKHSGPYLIINASNKLA